jgi:hypothetical protein
VASGTCCFDLSTLLRAPNVVARSFVGLTERLISWSFNNFNNDCGTCIASPQPPADPEKKVVDAWLHPSTHALDKDSKD